MPPGDTKCCHLQAPTRWRGGIRWHKDPSHPRDIRDGCAHPRRKVRSIQLTGNARDELQGPEHAHGAQRPQVHVRVEVCPSRGEDAVGTQGHSRVIPGKGLGHFRAMFSHQAGGSQEENQVPGQVQGFNSSPSLV